MRLSRKVKLHGNAWRRIAAMKATCIGASAHLPQNHEAVTIWVESWTPA
ncbi:hypothetical protein NC651_036767 [Populus alba x Populus x berolinensis]|nr:hypothetical protein NC651_036767 [Populus alba x Populus x berolinensis]